MATYKLCRVITTGTCTVFPIDEEGHNAGDVLTANEDDGSYYYAIYEDLGDNDWDEWGYYDQDFEKALEEYKKLVEK